MTATRRSFGPAEYGVGWAMAQLPEAAVCDGRYFTGKDEVAPSPLPGAKGQDDYAIRFGRGKIEVLSNTAVGTIAAVLRLGDLLRTQRRRDFSQHLRFRTRNYKHEVRLGAEDPRSVVRYTDETWETLCRRIVSHQFNGLVLYPPQHPFEYILDYEGFPEAASQPAAHRDAVRKALNRGLAIAHRYGLTTFMQHYINHFTRPLADAHRIPTTGRLSAIDHPVVDRYCRYCYREIFRQVPDLDGLYFNFESTPSGWQHLMKTAIPECNRMKRRPILFFRLWGFTEPEGMRAMMKAYKGRVILGHKISDTSDVYYLPVADSRVREWKKILGKDIEWTFLVGPCHNCGTNLCGQLWGDYGFVQGLLADAAKKGADSFSFHTYHELFAADIRDNAAFSEHEKAMSRLNFMHVQAVADAANGRQTPRDEQAIVLAGRAGVGPNAGPALLDAIEASSQLVLLAYRQFCYTSALDGYLNRGRYSHIQDPFFYYPANELNDQHRRLAWRGFLEAAWLDKRLPAKIAPEDEYQRIIDYADPSKPRAKTNPKKIADLLKEDSDRSFAALAEYRRLAGKKAAAALETYVRENAAFGEYVRHEILAAIRLYSIYFSESKAAVIAALKDGLKELRALPPLVADTKGRTCKTMVRVAMFNRLDPTPEIEAAEELLRLVEKTDFPMKAFAAYLESRRLYNEIRRVVRPGRRHDAPVMAYAVRRLKASLRAARRSLAELAKPGNATLAGNVRAWLDFAESELVRTAPPEIPCPSAPTGPFVPLAHEHSFRAGENFVEDFLGFFRRFDYLRSADQAFRVWRTKGELVVAFRERGIDIAQRKARWREYRDEGSCAYVMQVHVDVEGKGRDGDAYIVWPMATSVTKNRQPHVKAKAEFACDAQGWQTTVRLPWRLLGKKPRRGDVWGFNMYANPAVARNCCYTWAAQYDSFNPVRFGKIRFE